MTEDSSSTEEDFKYCQYMEQPRGKGYITRFIRPSATNQTCDNKNHDTTITGEGSARRQVFPEKSSTLQDESSSLSFLNLLIIN